MKTLFAIPAAAIICALAGLTQQGEVSGRIYPERNDDLAWENDVVAFRAYGPATQARGEKAFGYDLFFKYPDRGPVVERLYAAQTSPANWAAVDSLRKISRQAAADYERSFTYHVDHGLGFDPYPVGPTLGVGTAALLDSAGNIIFPWCYREAEIIENGPDRFTALLTFAPVTVGGTLLTEHRLITLPAGSHFNLTRVWYEGQTTPLDYFIGIPRRDDSAATLEPATGSIVYTHPTDGIIGHEVMLGLSLPHDMRDYSERQGHIGAAGTLQPGDTIVYRWGYTWPGSDIAEIDEWIACVRHARDNE